MNKLEHLVSAHALTALLRIRYAWLVAVSLLLSCSTVHVEPGTETGNPPVLDVDKLALVVESDSVRIVGSAGAVSPGGANVEATIVGTGEVVRGKANADGSFEIQLPTNAEAVVEVRARSGDAGSRTAYVTRGGALVGGGEGAALTCMQRSNLASQAAGSLASAADTSCQSAADCALASNKTVCTDSCSDLPIASRAVASLRAGIATIDRDLCGSFASDGCNVLAQPCVPPPQGPVACVAGKCTQLDQRGPLCPSCLEQTLTWGPSNPGATRHTISGCDDYAQTTMSGPGCMGKVAHCGGSATTTLEALITALAHPDVEAALASGTNVGGPPTPGGFATNVRLGEREFVISNCGTGPNCTAIPSGVIALRELLNGVASESACEPLSCPPNAVFTRDACAACGAAGCSSTSARCTVLCPDSSACASGLSCSARGICEAVCGS